MQQRLERGFMDIGRAATESGVSVKMIRHYEAIGLMPRAARTAANYRVYGPNDVQTLRFIKRARTLGFPIEAIEGVLGLWRNKSRSSATVKKLAAKHIDELKPDWRNSSPWWIAWSTWHGTAMATIVPNAPFSKTSLNKEKHVDHSHHHHHADAIPSLSRVAWSATLHCLTGCAIGEVLGMVIGTALGWGNAATIALAVVLAFFFGYALTLVPLLKAISVSSAIKLALAADTASITVMEIVDNAIMLVIPGAMDAGLDSFLFWTSLGFSLSVAAVVAFPVNRWLIERGRGHAVVHGHGHH